MSAAHTWNQDDPWSIFSLSEMAEGGADAYLQKVAEAAALYFDASGASIFLSDCGDSILCVRARAGGHSTVPDTAVIVPGQGVAGRIVCSGVARILGDISTEPDLIDIAPLDSNAAVSSSLVVPLLGYADSLVGVLNLSRHSSCKPFQSEDLVRARALAAMICLAVENAQLVEKLRSETKEAERLRRLAEIGQMTAAIAHEIRNPLTGIRSAAQIVRENPELSGEFLGVIDEEVLKLNALCDEFLAFAKPTTLNQNSTELVDLVQHVCDRCSSEFEADGVLLTVETGSDVPTMNLDRRQIEQVVYNLLRNARQACMGGGHVVVTVSGTRLTVQDDGLGMTADQIERLFSPFFTTKADGTGLGLCNVRKIVDAHGGRITVNSTQGKGSTFTVELARSGY